MSIKDKLKELELQNITDLTENHINILYKYCKNSKKKTKKIIKKTIDKVPKTDEKYKVALLFLNQLMQNMGKKEMDDITKFVDIDKEDLLIEKNKKLLWDEIKNMWKHFDKMKCGYYNSRKRPQYLLYFVKGMIKQLGYNTRYKQKEISIGNSARRSHSYYSIV